MSENSDGFDSFDAYDAFDSYEGLRRFSKSKDQKKKTGGFHRLTEDGGKRKVTLCAIALAGGAAANAAVMILGALIALKKDDPSSVVSALGIAAFLFGAFVCGIAGAVLSREKTVPAVSSAAYLLIHFLVSLFFGSSGIDVTARLAFYSAACAAAFLGAAAVLLPLRRRGKRTTGKSRKNKLARRLEKLG